jgi:hypothetical protein
MLYTSMMNFCLDFAEPLAFPVLEIMRENVKED